MSAGHGLLRPVPREGHPAPTLLGVWAHPDDEAYLSAGLMAALTAAGWRVVVATATRGESGTDDPEALPPARLAAVRQQELADSLAVLGVTDHRWLRASRPLLDGELADLPEQEGAGIVAGLLEDVRPDLVVTFGPDGLTGHSDHRAVSRWTTRAWQQGGACGELWYAALTSDFLARWGRLCTEQSVWMDGGPPAPVADADLVHVEVCSGARLDRKFAALAAHTSQTAGLIARVGEERYRAWWSTEAFVSAAAVSSATTQAA
ncbi:PIG-L deacetylase family protein [Blastococcus deserti]|uniref:PIG-L deacetylase family protein n=1 Tax=Blastococcus deserti TaxID=2259033 RepID=A0ABW4XDG9_9ACTN